MTDPEIELEPENASNKKYTFIHIPKCGGSSVETYFEMNYNNYITGTTHKWVCEKDNNPIVIIRNPIDRFISLYHYWKNGSHGRNSRTNEFTDKYGNFNIKDFIKMYKDNTESIKNNYMHELVNGYMWRIHYFPQTYWINPSFFSNSIVIVYADDLSDKITSLLQFLNIENKGIELCKSNITRKKDNELNIILDEEDSIWIREHFKEDFDLWDKANNNPDLFKCVI